ncbi:MAG: DNA-3-methyladenine glycosylase 2 family protein [Herpetosiphonaceae bacterium]|nr:DNA-3-methyladenine glycosylase 2 family protein [Herpetosiphonaceae bacterium]
MQFEIKPSGPFSLTLANRYFGGWLSLDPKTTAPVVAFPVEGWNTAAAVIMRQDEGGSVVGEVHTAPDAAEAAWWQALATLSLDMDGSAWPEVGSCDSVIGRLQQKYEWLRPVLFHSPYEAAAAFVIGHRISIQQGRAIRQLMAQELGEVVQVGEVSIPTFPRPQVLREVSSFKGVSAEKIARLHNIAQAALDGLLDRAYLRSIAREQALKELCALSGIGPFFAQGILLRGAGIVDEVTDDDITKQAVQRAYQLPQLPNHSAVLEIAEAWRPYRMWANVLLHVWLRSEAGGPLRQGKRGK